MKTPKFYRLSVLMPIAIILTCLAFFCSCKADETDNVLPNYDVSGTARGSQVVPAVSGTGNASIAGSYNPNNRLLTFTSSWAGLSGQPTGGGFYTGAAGVAGANLGTSWVFNGNLATSGSTSGSLTLTAQEAEELLLGRLYFTYLTAFNPGGEVRGQVITSR